MSTRLYRVVLFEPGTARAASEQKVRARTSNEAAECLCAEFLIDRGSNMNLRAQVAPVDSPAQKTLLYSAGRTDAPALALVHAFQRWDQGSGAQIRGPRMATAAQIERVRGEILSGESFVVDAAEVDMDGWHRSAAQESI